MRFYLTEKCVIFLNPEKHAEKCFFFGLKIRARSRHTLFFCFGALFGVRVGTMLNNECSQRRSPNTNEVERTYLRVQTENYVINKRVRAEETAGT